MNESPYQEGTIAILMRHVAYDDVGGVYNISLHGIKQALEVVTDLIEKGYFPDLVLHSPAPRTEQTGRRIGLEFRQAGHRLLVRKSQGLEKQILSVGILDELSHLPDSVKCVAVVAHSEGLKKTLQKLAPDATASFKLGTAIVLRLPTSSWREVPNVRDATVLHVCVPA